MIIIVIAILPISMMQQVSGEAVSLVVSTDSVSMNMNLVLQENLTALPQINAHIGPGNSTSLVQLYLQPFRDAIQRTTTGADVSSINLSITTTNSTKLWTLYENYSLTITGTNSNSRSEIASRLNFVSMNVSQPLQIGGLEYNQGPTGKSSCLSKPPVLHRRIQPTKRSHPRRDNRPIPTPRLHLDPRGVNLERQSRHSRPIHRMAL